MGESASESGEFVHDESLLDLLMRQQTRGEQGVRLSFHQELLSSLPFSSSPYHYCAVTGNTELAFYLYSNGIHMSRNITVASFSASGTSGNTPWTKSITITPREAALLAGNRRTARALWLFEKGVPHKWSRNVHRKFPHEFREKAKAHMQVLLKSDWFLPLPGPARVAVVNEVMRHLCRTMVWNCVDKKCWNSKWEEVLGDELYTAANSLPKKPVEGPLPAPSRPYPQYQFRVAQAQHQGNGWRRIKGFLGGIRQVTLGAAWWFLQKQQGGTVPLLSSIGMFVASGAHPALQVGLPLMLTALGQPVLRHKP